MSKWTHKTIVSMDSNFIQDVANPSLDQDAATKKYVDDNSASNPRLDWIDLVTTWTTEPAAQSYSGGDGEVFAYVYGGTTYYRFVPTTYDSALDIFYTTFSDPTLSGVVATRGASI